MSEEKSLNFLEDIVEADLASGKSVNIHTRFPPEPNGYLHIGHAKSICLNFGLADRYKGKTNLRFDDTNPVTEDTEYVDSIKQDVRWLGFDWEEEHYASDYFNQLYAFAVDLIKKGLQVDKIMFFTDCQLWNSKNGFSSVEKSWKTYKKIAPHAKLYLFDLAGYGNTPLSIQNNDVYLIAGWSDKVFDVLDAIENGENAIEKIKQIVL
jgi:hypothetical protein